MSEAHRYDPVEFEDCKVVGESKMALRVRINGDLHWIPKSQILDDSEVYSNGPEDRGYEGTLVIPTWLAEEKGLV